MRQPVIAQYLRACAHNTYIYNATAEHGGLRPSATGWSCGLAHKPLANCHTARARIGFVLSNMAFRSSELTMALCRSVGRPGWHVKWRLLKGSMRNDTYCHSDGVQRVYADVGEMKEWDGAATAFSFFFRGKVF